MAMMAESHGLMVSWNIVVTFNSQDIVDLLARSHTQKNERDGESNMIHIYLSAKTLHPPAILDKLSQHGESARDASKN